VDGSVHAVGQDEFMGNSAEPRISLPLRAGSQWTNCIKVLEG